MPHGTRRSASLKSRSFTAPALLCLFLFLLPARTHATIGIEYQLLLGNPSAATTDTNNHDHYLISRTVQCLDYSDTLGLPVWASWNLTASDIGTNDRSSFITDSTLPANFYRVKSSDYTGSGYDRGHLCPSKDRTDTAANNDLVFYMSNVMPQNGLNNSGVWLQFENYCRDLVQSTNNFELLILCGPSGFNGDRINTNGPVFIPGYVWKIAVVVPPGPGYATNRITTTNRVIALKIPNDDTATNAWPSYVTSANQIQVDTGLTFFTALPANVAVALRAKVDGQTNPPPSIATFTPADGPASTSVTITGTNFSSATAVAFNGAPASFTLDSASQITAIVPTNAGSGFVSVTTPSGTAISANPFTVLNNGGSVYSGLLAAWDVSALTNYGPSPLTPTTNAANISVGGLTRGNGVKTSGSAAAGAWGGVAFTNTTVADAISSNQVATFSLTASNGYHISFTRFSRFDYYRSATGPTNGVLQYQVGAGAFSHLTNLSYTTAGSPGGSIGAIDLTSVTALQDVEANTTVTFRIVNYGGGSLGTWYIYNTQNTTAPDLALQGVVTQILTTNAPAAPFLSIAAFTNDTFTFTLTGTTGASYVVQATTNLPATLWSPLTTNLAPFTFTDTNALQLPRRFYRAMQLP